MRQQAALSGHTAISAKMVSDIEVLYLLGMALLAACGLAYTLLAHRYGVFNPTLCSIVVLLFMVLQLVPWGLCEALFATGIVYCFTASTLSASQALKQLNDTYGHLCGDRVCCSGWCDCIGEGEIRGQNRA